MIRNVELFQPTYEYYRKTNFTIKYNKNSKIAGKISNAKSLI